MRLAALIWFVLAMLTLAIDCRSGAQPPGGGADLLLPGGSAWLNTVRPLTRADARGRLVLLDFWDYTCVNCIRTLPHLQRWQEQYGDKGLLIIGVHSPEFAFARERDKVAAAVHRFGLTYPVVLDNDFAIWKRYNDQQVWPYKVLLDPSGAVISSYAGEGGYGETEQLLRRELAQIHPDVKLPLMARPAGSATQPEPTWRAGQTPELYASWRGITGGQFGQQINGRSPQLYPPPASPQRDVIYLDGRWEVTREYSRPADPAADYKAAVVLHFRANEVNAVFDRVAAGPGPTSQPDPPADWIRVLVDGRPLTGANKGGDVTDRDGRSLLPISQGRMYRIYDSARWGEHTLRLEFKDNAVGLFAFTFGSRAE